MSRSSIRVRTALESRLAAEVREQARGMAESKQATVSAILALAALIVWAATGMNYFWPMWAWLGLAIPLAFRLGIRWARAQPSGPQRRLAMQGALSVVIVCADVAIWAMSGGGYFWPVFPLAALGGAFALHAAVTAPRRASQARRVDELTRTRRGALDVQAAQLRRIERDLHDGAQARLVALSIQLGRAEERLRDNPETAALVRGAKEEATAAIAELRDLARGISPPVLADRGLVAAVAAIAERSPAHVNVVANVPRRPPPVVETAAYFVVAESLTNAAKHAPGATVKVTLTQPDESLLIDVSDDGPGGADPAGSGLTGLRQRVEALDGTLQVASVPGDGTTISAELPCG